MNAQNMHFQYFKNTAIVQFRTDFINTFEYISISEGMNRKFIEVREIDESGSVNHLSVINRSEFFVFMSDGDILKGAKQNRVLNTSVLIEPKSQTIIPVSCVEAGRWRRSTDIFEYENFSAPVHLRSDKAWNVKKNLNSDKLHNSDQGKIWKFVSDYQKDLNYFSETSNLSEVYEAKHRDIENLTSKYNPEKNSNGIAIFINAKLLNLEVYNSSKIYEEYFPRLLKGAFMDVYSTKRKDIAMTEAEAFYKTNDFLDIYENLNFEIHKGVAAGTEKRFDTSEFSGLELIYKDKTIHLAALNLKKESKQQDYI